MSELQGISRIKIGSGKLEEFKRLAAQIVAVTRTKDKATLQFEVYLNDDETECVVLERYRDSEALIEHHLHLGELGSAIGATGSVTGACLGEPTAEVRMQLSDAGIQLFKPHLSL